MIHYLHTLETTVDIFGYIFSDIHIRRWNSDKTEKKDIYVPIEFTGKERMFYLLNNKMKDENIKINSVFPRMGYSISDIFYDSSRMLNRDIIISDNYSNTTGDYIETEANRLPYNVKFDLDIAATHKTDLFMILEQILPWFRPSYVIQAKLNPYVGDSNVSIPIVLENAIYNDFNQEAPFSDTENKLYMFTLRFNVKTWLYSLNNEDNNGGYPSDSGIGKAIKEIELGTCNWNDSRPVTDDSLYTIHYPEHIN